MYEIIKVFLPLLVYLFILVLILRGRRHTRETYRLMKKMNDSMINRIDHLYTLINILNEGLCSPIHKLIFSKVLRGDFKTFKSTIQSFESFKEILIKKYSEGREKLIKREKECKDPIIEVKYQNHITIIDNILNLLSSVDENTSEEHLRTVMDEINLSIMKLEKSYQDLNR